MSKRRKIRSSLHREIYNSTNQGINSERKRSGTGNIIIPSDIDRDDYIKYVYQTGELFIITPSGEVIKDARVSKEVLQCIDFPNNPEDTGTLVCWVNIPILNQCMILGTLLNLGEMYSYKEYEKVRDLQGKTKDNHITEVWNSQNPQALLDVYFAGDVDEEDEDSGIIHKARSSKHASSLILNCNGISKIASTLKTEIFSDEEILLQIGEEEDQVLKLTLDVKGNLKYIDKFENEISIDGESGDVLIHGTNSIKLGKDAEEPAVLGDTLAKLLDDIINAIKTITVPTALGPSGVPVNNPQFITIQNQINNIKSLLVFNK